MGIDTEAIVAGFSYAGIFALMTLNGFGPFVSSQVLYIIVGYFISTGSLLLLPASLIGAIGNTIGNILLYEPVRKYGVVYVKKFKVFREEDLRKAEIALGKRGLWFLFIGKLLPALKVFIPIAAAVGKVHRGIFIALMFVSSWIWSFMFIAIGYTFGKSTQVWKSYSIIVIPLAALILYLFYRMLNSKEVLRELEAGKKNPD